MENTLYLTLNKKETWLGWLAAIVYIGLFLILGLQHWELLWLLSILVLIVFSFLFRKFVRETIANIPLLGKKVWIRPAFAVLVNLVICTVFNDILMLYQLPFFVNSEWGPVLWDIRAYFISQQQSFWFVALVLVFVLPVVEELIFRQLIFSTFYPKSRTVAIILSVFLFAFFHVFPFVGGIQNLTGSHSTFYLFAYSFQFIPIGLLACWLFLSTDTVVTPIIMHILYNALLVYTAMGYIS